MITSDGGYAVYNIKTDEYYCGLNKFNKQLRQAKIYHSKKWADDVIETWCSQHAAFRADEFRVLTVQMQIVNK